MRGEDNPFRITRERRANDDQQRTEYDERSHKPNPVVRFQIHHVEIQDRANTVNVVLRFHMHGITTIAAIRQTLTIVNQGL